MRSGIALALLLPLLAAEGAAAAPRARAAAPKPTEKPMPQLMQSCDAHKFETLVTAVVDGQPRQSKVKLCGVEGQTDADWIKTLEDAIAKLDANKEMAPPVRDQIVTAIKAEIARLTITGSVPAKANRSAEAASNATPLSRDYSSLPPLPVSGESATPLPAPRETTAEPIRKDFAQLPPLPPPVVPATSSLLATSKLVAAVAPPVTFGCDTPGEMTTDAPCAAFERDTMLTVHAGEDIPEGILLQFVRNDQPQGDIALGGLRRGRSLRLALPTSVCRGFASGKLELRIVNGDGSGAPQPLKSDGPYSLRC